MIHQGIVRPECGEPKKAPLTDHEKKLVEAKLVVYYEQNWHSVIMQIIGYKNPLIVNAHKMTSLSQKIDQSNPVYFYVDWIKPGRHHFTV